LHSTPRLFTRQLRRTWPTKFERAKQFFSGRCSLHPATPGQYPKRSRGHCMWKPPWVELK
ncbi:MAG: hypothetical protein QXI12_09345, partial [Candidatus Methanomethyliaceae archaeon]